VTLTEVGRRLIDIYGQSEHQSLTRPEEHIEILDSFAGLTDLRAEMTGAFKSYISLKRELDELTRDSKSLEEKKDYLAHISKEIGEAAPVPGEVEELTGVKERLKNSERIKEATVGAETAIYSDAGSAVERLGAALKPLREIAHLDEKLTKSIESIESAVYALEDAASFLRDYSQSVEYDPELLEHIGDRLDLIGRLKKKYGPTIEDVLRKKEEADRELDGLTDYAGRLGELTGGVKAAQDKALLVSNRLTEQRKKAAVKLKKKIEEELGDLGMEGTVFEVVIDPETGPDSTPRVGEKGADRVVFYISPNPGEEVKPLARIASGGELSRIMLAMKRVTAAGRVPTLVFDEIDTGVGGAMAQVVGLKLHEVSAAHQVLCVTHLPQIAAFAKKHYAVTKGGTKEGRTVTSIEELDAGGRLEHISVMLGGVKVTETTKKHAKELLDAAKKLTKRERGKKS
jgi:DNA repair protein RecN (Recombination protein N)